MFCCMFLMFRLNSGNCQFISRYMCAGNSTKVISVSFFFFGKNKTKTKKKTSCAFFVVLIIVLWVFFKVYVKSFFVRCESQVCYFFFPFEILIV